MSQNTSPAVMQQRREARYSLDFFPTPPWATRALCERLEIMGYNLGKMTAWEPACGEGHMARPLAEYFRAVDSSDVRSYGFGRQEDFLFYGSPSRADWVVTNPPFRLASEFAQMALRRATIGAALLVRTAFLEGIERHATLFTRLPPMWVLQFTERVPMHKGRLVADGSTATAYCWLVWMQDNARGETRLGWLAPCRRRLERPEDYANGA